jgi:hypothetical protein
MIGLTQFFGASIANEAMLGVKSIVPVLGSLAVVGLGLSAVKACAKPSHAHDAQQPAP